MKGRRISGWWSVIGDMSMERKSLPRLFNYHYPPAILHQCIYLQELLRIYSGEHHCLF